MIPLISGLVDAELDIETIVLPQDCKPIELREYVVDAHADVYIVGSSTPNRLSAYVAAHTTKPVIGIPISGDTSDIKNIIFQLESMPTGTPYTITNIDDTSSAGYIARKCIADAL